jgi:hypothetical protein
VAQTSAQKTPRTFHEVEPVAATDVERSPPERASSTCRSRTRATRRATRKSGWAASRGRQNSIDTVHIQTNPGSRSSRRVRPATRRWPGCASRGHSRGGRVDLDRRRGNAVGFLGGARLRAAGNPPRPRLLPKSARVDAMHVDKSRQHHGHGDRNESVPCFEPRAFAPTPAHPPHRPGEIPGPGGPAGGSSKRWHVVQSHVQAGAPAGVADRALAPHRSASASIFASTACSSRRTRFNCAHAICQIGSACSSLASVTGSRVRRSSSTLRPVRNYSTSKRKLLQSLPISRAASTENSRHRCVADVLRIPGHAAKRATGRAALRSAVDLYSPLVCMEVLAREPGNGAWTTRCRFIDRRRGCSDQARGRRRRSCATARPGLTRASRPCVLPTLRRMERWVASTRATPERRDRGGWNPCVFRARSRIDLLPMAGKLTEAQIGGEHRRARGRECDDEVAGTDR